jgi:hypothetical protein
MSMPGLDQIEVIMLQGGGGGSGFSGGDGATGVDGVNGGSAGTSFVDPALGPPSPVSGQKNGQDGYIKVTIVQS